MGKSIKQLLAEPNDSELCNGVFLAIVDHHGNDIDASAICEEERVVLLVWHASGVIGNGGFRYLLEGTLKGDPHFALTASAFQTTGCIEAAEAVRNTLAIFPKSRPPADIGERLKYYLKRLYNWPTDMDTQFFDAMGKLKKCLANYVRSHADAFLHLENPKTMVPPKKDQMPVQTESDRNSSGPILANLPHWARVAFAARCALRVFSLLELYWPNVPSRHSEAVRLAIDLAQQSTVEGRAVEGLRNAVMRATAVAGASLASNPEFVRGEPGPKNAFSGTIASFVAKAAEKAAEAARTDGDNSLFAAMEALDYATSAATSAEAGIAEKLNQDFSHIYRAANRGQWTDRTKVPSDIWSKL